MPIRPALTSEDLEKIGERQDAADVALLLGEVRRLRGIVLRADQLQISLVQTRNLILDALRNELNREPWIHEERQRLGA